MYGDCENAPFQSQTAENIIDPSCQLVSSEIHPNICTKATPPRGYSQPTTEHNKIVRQASF